MNIITEESIWLLLPCLVIALLITLVLYFRNQKFDFSRNVTIILAIIRFFSFFFLLFFLLSPLLKTVLKNTEKPIIVLAQDNSQSIILGKDSSYYKNEYVNSLKALSDELSNDYTVRTLYFNSQTSDNQTINFSGVETDISSVFQEIESRFSNRNVGAVILATDGLFNKGANPTYATGNLKFPVFPVALGDTAVQKDLIVYKVNYNRTALLGNTFPLEIIVKANQAKSENSVLQVTHDGASLFSRNLQFNSTRFSQIINISLPASTKGLQKYEIELVPVDQEISLLNNKQTIYIEVTDVKQKVLILSPSPHPDVFALKQAIENSSGFSVEDHLVTEFTQPINAYNLIILNQLPSAQVESGKLIERIIQSEVPLLFIIGAQTQLQQFNNLETGLKIVTGKASFNDPKAQLNDRFTFFTINEETKGLFPYLPPLLAPFGDFQIFKNSDILAFQKIGSLVTSIPLLAFGQNSKSRVGFITGEGIYRWRLTDYKINNSHQAFDALVSKFLVYLTVSQAKSNFRVFVQQIFRENEPVQIDAEVYNQSFELINDPDVNITISNENDEKFPFTFSKTFNSYHLNAGLLPPGNYRYSANVKNGDKILTSTGQFTIVEVNVETLNTTANHNLLHQMAIKTNGKMFYPREINQIPEMLKKREDIKPVRYFHTRFTELINIWWILGLIIVLLSTEWFIRKFSGGY